MKTPHEWPQPPLTIKISSSRRKPALDTSLTSSDLRVSRRYHSYSDGDDDLRSREPLEAHCQSRGEIAAGIPSSASDDYKGFRSSAYRKAKGILSSGDAGYQEGFRHAGEVKATSSNTTQIISAYREDKAKLPANRRVDQSSRAPQQPLLLNPYPFPGALKFAERSHTAVQRILPTRAVATKESTCLDTGEPFSPRITCLGRVRMKEKQSHEAEKSHTKQIHEVGISHTEDPQTSKDVQRIAQESKQQSEDKPQKAISKKEIAEKGSCLRRRKKREELRTFKLFGPSSSVVSPLQTTETETRRERAALLARSLTSLLDDLRRLDMEDSAYVPAVPPRNSLLLMRGHINNSCNQEVSTLLYENACHPEESSNITVNEDSCKHNDVKMQKIARAENSAAQLKAALAPQKVFPLSEIESNFLVQNASSSSEMNNKRPTDARQQELALWQRRAIGKLSAIEIKGPKRMEIIKPSTK